MSGYLFPLLALIILFIGVPWLILHYSAQMKARSGLTADETKMLEALWKSSRLLARRIEVLESILDDDKNNKDKKHD